jgi:hypothetical protein
MIPELVSLPRRADSPPLIPVAAHLNNENVACPSRGEFRVHSGKYRRRDRKSAKQPRDYA